MKSPSFHSLLNRALRTNFPREVSALVVVGFFVAIGYGLIIPAIPLFARTFGVTKAAIGLIVSTFAFVRFASGLVSGRLVNRFGERKTLGYGVLMVAVSTTLTGLSQSYEQLLVFRAIGGLGSSMFSVAASSLLMRSVHDDQRAQAQSVYNGGFLVGGIAGPAFGGILMAISLRAPFFVYTGTLLCASATAFIFLTNRRLGTNEVRDTNDEITMSIRQAIRMYPYQATLALAFLINWVIFGLRASIIPLFVTEELHSTASVVGLGFALSALAQGIFLLKAGKFSDTFGRKRTLLIGSILTLISITMLTISQTRWEFILAMAITGFGGAFLGTVPASLVGDILRGRGGGVVGLWQMAGDAGMIVGPIVVGFLADISNYRTAFGVSGALFALTLIIAVTLPETRRSALQQ